MEDKPVAKKKTAAARLKSKAASTPPPASVDIPVYVPKGDRESKKHKNPKTRRERVGAGDMPPRPPRNWPSIFTGFGDRKKWEPSERVKKAFGLPDKWVWGLLAVVFAAVVALIGSFIEGGIWNPVGDNTQKDTTTEPTVISTKATTESPADALKPESIIITNPEQTLELGENHQLNIKFNPDDRDIHNDRMEYVRWTSSKEGIVRVDKNGLLMALYPGNATITAAFVCGNGKKIIDTWSVTVPGEQTIETLEFSLGNAHAVLGEKTKLQFKYSPECATVSKKNVKANDGYNEVVEILDIKGEDGLGFVEIRMKKIVEQAGITIYSIANENIKDSMTVTPDEKPVPTTTTTTKSTTMSTATPISTTTAQKITTTTTITTTTMTELKRALWLDDGWLWSAAKYIIGTVLAIPAMLAAFGYRPFMRKRAKFKDIEIAVGQKKSFALEREGFPFPRYKPEYYTFKLDSEEYRTSGIIIENDSVTGKREHCYTVNVWYQKPQKERQKKKRENQKKRLKDFHVNVT